MPDLTIWVSGADFIEMGEFLAEEGSNFLKLLVVYPFYVYVSLTPAGVGGRAKLFKYISSRAEPCDHFRGIEHEQNYNMVRC